MGCIQSDSAVTREITATVKHPKKKRRRPSRMSTRFRMQDVREISDEERHGGYKPCYPCPICFVYFNKILACSECTNFICLACLISYEKKTQNHFKCPFCASTSSLFIDYEFEAHSYFDSTNNGFISKEERNKADEELERGKERSKLENQNSRLDPIAEQNY